MRITANQVTLVRLLMLPLPVAMVYGAGLGWKLGALAVFVILGLTDALDGYLARRHGSTPLGALLDPIVDKIFLVAAFLPLADLGIISIPLVSLVFVREFAVTALRSIALEERVAFRTSRIAKLKTTVQMAGAGFILLVWLFPRDGVIWTILGAGAAASLVPIAIKTARGKPPGWRALWGGGLICGVALTRVALGQGPHLALLMLTIVAFTVLSGLEYGWGMRRILARRFRAAPLEALRLAGLSLAIPVFMLPMAPAAPALLFFSIMAVVAAELAVGGVDNSLTQAGAGRGPRIDLLRSAAQTAAGVLLWFLPFSGSALAASVVTGVALTLTLADLVVRLVKHAQVFRVHLATPDRPSRPVPRSVASP